VNTLHIIKIGGNVIDDAETLGRFLDDLARLTTAWILVHGGGKLASDVSERFGIQTQMVQGRRVTDAATLEVVTMVYGGLVNKRIVAGLQARGVNALGLTGADGDIIRARKRTAEPNAPDYGFVGDVETVHGARLQMLLASGFVPVIAPLTHDGKGSMLNTNADTIAAEIAAALASSSPLPVLRLASPLVKGGLTGDEDAEFSPKVHLVYCFEKRGVLRSVEDNASVIQHLSTAEYQRLRASEAIAKGMIPKLDNAFAAVQRGLASVRICHSDDIVAAVNGESCGTLIRNELFNDQSLKAV
jgi:acetylglutamate kinase